MQATARALPEANVCIRNAAFIGTSDHLIWSALNQRLRRVSLPPKNISVTGDVTDTVLSFVKAYLVPPRHATSPDPLVPLAASPALFTLSTSLPSSAAFNSAGV